MCGTTNNIKMKISREELDFPSYYDSYHVLKRKWNLEY